MSYYDQSPSNKKWYDTNVKANSNKKNEFVYITKKGEKTTKTKKQFQKLFKVYDDAPTNTPMFLEKIGSAPPVPGKGEGYQKLVKKYEEQIDTKPKSKEESDESMSIEEQMRMKEIELEKDRQFLEKTKKTVEKLRLQVESNDISINEYHKKLLDLYDETEPFVEDPSSDYPFQYTDEWKVLRQDIKQTLDEEGLVEDNGEIRRDIIEQGGSLPSIPNPLQEITDAYKEQQLEDLRKIQGKNVENMESGKPIVEIGPDEVNQIHSDPPVDTPPELAIRNEELKKVYDDLLVVTAQEIGIESKTDATAIATNLSVASAESLSSMQPQVSESDMQPQPAESDVQPQPEQQVEAPMPQEPIVKPNVQARAAYKFEVRFHKAQIAEYFFDWSAPNWDQQLSDSIKNSEELYTKEYLLATMKKLITDPYFKIESVVTDMNSSMDDILTEYHEISQIQFCKQRNMQTGKREKLIGMKLKDLINITSIATGNQPTQQDSPYAVDGVEPVDETMQSTPTEPNIVESSPSGEVIFPKDKEITIWEIGKKALENLTNENKPFNLNKQLIKDAQRNTGSDIIFGPMNEQTIFRNRVNITSLRRVITDQ